MKQEQAKEEEIKPDQVKYEEVKEEEVKQKAMKREEVKQEEVKREETLIGAGAGKINRVCKLLFLLGAKEPYSRGKYAFYCRG